MHFAIHFTAADRYLPNNERKKDIQKEKQKDR